MKLTLSKSDFAALSDESRRELAALLGLCIEVDTGTSDSATDQDQQDVKAEDLTFQAMKRFMSGVSTKTKSALKLFAKLDGETTVNEIEVKMGDGFHWAGFMSGVTRRLRKMTGDTTADFFQWENDSDEWKSQTISVSPMTCESLKKYFAI